MGREYRPSGRQLWRVVRTGYHAVGPGPGEERAVDEGRTAVCAAVAVMRGDKSTLMVTVAAEWSRLRNHRRNARPHRESDRFHTQYHCMCRRGYKWLSFR